VSARSLPVAVAVLALAALAACSSGTDITSASLTQHRTLVVNENPTELCVAVAATLGEKVAGLSNRSSLPPREGMAFPFAIEAQRSFTMEDTAVPLTIAWVATGGQVLGSTALTPFDKTPKDSPGPIILAVELLPQDWGPISATARTITLGQTCDGTITAGRPGTKQSQF
jgi:uncharacterized membrane protein (UPF0127 family)